MTKTSAAPKPPGPLRLPFVGSSLSFVRDPFGYVTRMAATHGDIVYSTFAGADLYLLNNPEHVQHVLLGNRKNYVKDRFLRRIKSLLGEGLLTSEGDLWRSHRKQMSPAFARRRVDAYAPSISACTEDVRRAWPDGGRLDLSAEMMRLTLDIAVRTLFGAQAGDDAKRVGAAFQTVAEHFGRSVANPFPAPLWVPTAGNRRYQAARAELESVVYRIIADRRRDGALGDDLLSGLLQAQDEQGRGMSDVHLRDQAMTLLLAGHETTALTLTYTLHLLATHPAVERRLADELARVLGGRAPTVADLAKLPLLDQVVTESLRLYPPAALMGREALAADEIGGYAIRAGSTVISPQWVLHRDARYWEAPDAFRPERWTPELRASLPKFAYFPFGGGHRVCIGEAFALLEAKLALAALVQNHHFCALDARPLERVLTITMRPKRPVQMIVSAREGAATKSLVGGGSPPLKGNSN